MSRLQKKCLLLCIGVREGDADVLKNLREGRDFYTERGYCGVNGFNLVCQSPDIGCAFDAGTDESTCCDGDRQGFHDHDGRTDISG